MKAEQFCFWLQGYFELNPYGETLDKEQVECIKKHLALVFIHEIDPKMGNKAHQEKLNIVHNTKDHTKDQTLYRC